MTLRLTPEAIADLEDAYRWYRERRSTLGSDFLASVDDALSQVEAYPESFPVVHRDVRRALLRRFPYCLFYRNESEGALVVGCFHARRDPHAWRGRAGA